MHFPETQRTRRSAIAGVTTLCVKEKPMSEDTGFQFTDDAVPRAYDEVLMPRLFEPWALLLLDECNLRPNADELGKLGWTDGRNVRIDYRTGAADSDAIRTYAAEIIASRPDVVLAARRND